MKKRDDHRNVPAGLNYNYHSLIYVTQDLLAPSASKTGRHSYFSIICGATSELLLLSTAMFSSLK